MTAIIQLVKKGGEMREAEPEKYAVTVTVRVSEEERHRLKLLAVREKKTLKAVLFEALDKTFPHWRKDK